jgi:hypothetical protein
MSAILDTPRPGDVISSDLMTRIVTMLNAHEAALSGTSAGGVVVPSLFGRTLAETRVALGLQQLVLGTVVNVFGATVNTSGSSTGTLMVLNQVPAGGARTVAGAAVNLVVSAQSGTTPTQPPVVPVFNLAVPASVRAGETVELRGSGFAGVSSSVTFAGIAGIVLGTSNQGQLFVTVPPGIPGAPSLPGAPDASGIVVRISNPDGAFVNGSITIRAPLANPLSISSISPDPATVGQPITISGSGFTTTPSQHVVHFGSGVNATPTAATATQLIVTVPTGIPGLTTPGDSTTVNLTVERTTDGAISGSKPLSIDR